MLQLFSLVQQLEEMKQEQEELMNRSSKYWLKPPGPFVVGPGWGVDLGNHVRRQDNPGR